ncbi:MAG: class I SAM-dependent methyltransferase [Candidatus Margulisiibacteriota bacterium]|nr:class I SAM-dependent methyltransferase [Candidatus Margulisiibacteriota bacterium]
MGVEFRPNKYEAWYKTPKGRFVDTLEKKVIADLCRIRGGDKVLEIGCGTGHFSTYFKELGAEVVGLDTSPEMLQVAKDLRGELKIDLSRGDAYHLPFADNSFDLVAMITTLEFIPSPKKALDEAFRVSKGKVFLGILNRNSLLAWKRKRSGKKVWQEAHFYSLKEVREILGKDKQIKWKSVVHLPLVNSDFAFNMRLSLENWLSRLRLLFGAFIGVLAE